MSELDAFYELEKMRYIYRNEYYSPTRAHFSHYTLRLAAAKRGLRVALGPLAIDNPHG